MFVVQVAADIFGNKLNFEFSFPSRPSLPELTRATETAFTTEIANTRPEGVPQHSFHVAKIKIYDENKNKWVDLVGEGQLIDYCQLYAFQPENPWHKETQKAIPPATKLPMSAYNGVSATTVAAAAVNRSGSNHAITGGTGVGSRAIVNTSSALAPYTGGRAGDARSETSSRRVGAAGGAVTGGSVNASTALVPRGADASPEEKLRVVFSEFDSKGTRMLDIDDFKQGFRNLGLDFSNATTEDLFERADTNHDSRISYSEFERFTRFYPIMTDCLFFRCKALWDEEQLKKEVQHERENVAKAEAQMESTQHAVESVEEEVTTAQSAVRAADEALKECTDRMRDLARDMDESRKEKERALREKKDRERDLSDVKEREKESRKDLQDLAREADKLDRRASALATDADAADEKVRQLMKALEDAKRVADRAHQAADQAASEADQAKEREKDAALEVDLIARDIPKVEEAMRAVDKAVTAAEQALKELDSIGKDLGREADEAARRREACELAVAEARDKVAQRVRDLEAVRQVVEERERSAKQKESELEEHRRQRDLITQHERTLIEQELRLREQRDSLEQRESKLMTEASSFLGNMRNIFTSGRSYSRDPSNF